MTLARVIYKITYLSSSVRLCTPSQLAVVSSPCCFGGQGPKQHQSVPSHLGYFFLQNFRQKVGFSINWHGFVAVPVEIL